MRWLTHNLILTGTYNVLLDPRYWQVEFENGIPPLGHLLEQKKCVQSPVVFITLGTYPCTVLNLTPYVSKFCQIQLNQTDFSKLFFKPHRSLQGKRNLLP